MGNGQQSTITKNVNIQGNQGAKQSWTRGRGKRQIAGNRQITPKKTGNIASRLGIKKSPLQRIQQYKLAMRIAANKQKAGGTRVTGNMQQGFTTKKNISSTGKLDARLKLAQKKMKMTDARQKILQKSQPSDARITIQSNLAKKGLADKKKKSPQGNKNVVDAAIPKVVFKNPQALQQQNKGHTVTTKESGGSLIRTVRK
jgi:hypothetical protein